MKLQNFIGDNRLNNLKINAYLEIGNWILEISFNLVKKT